MSKRVLSVGQCGPDTAAIRRLLEGSFAAQVMTADLPADTFEKLRAQQFDLVLINRKLDADSSDGIEILKAIKADPALTPVPVMLVTNYPEYQTQAVAAGAAPGFGKLELHKPETLEKLGQFLREQENEQAPARGKG